jgi:hypothetical protein
MRRIAGSDTPYSHLNFAVEETVLIPDPFGTKGILKVTEALTRIKTSRFPALQGKLVSEHAPSGGLEILATPNLALLASTGTP